MTNRKRVLQITWRALCLTAFSLATHSSVFAETSSGDAAGKRPNILFLMTDDQRNDTLGCAGHPIVKTPNIDRLAKEGVRFENMFVSNSICWVSRATILTGQFARSWGTPTKPDSIADGNADFIYPKVLHEAGYRNGFFGKWHARMPKGFDQTKYFDRYENIFRRPYFHTQPDGTKRHETQIIADRAIDFLRSQPNEEPFCLTLWFNASHAEDGDKRPGVGHFPWPKSVDGMYESLTMPTPRLNDPKIFESQPDFLKRSINRERFFWRWDTPQKYQINMRAYLRMISGIDHALARITQVLGELGQLDNTIIVYTADNGYYMGDRGFAGKWSHYEQSLRVPLIIWDPRLDDDQKGRVLSETVLNVDLPPTFLDYAGIRRPKSYEGVSLKPLVDSTNESNWRTDFFCEHVAVAPLLTWEGVRTKEFKYARYFDQGNFEFLHDLRSDPDELKNLAKSQDHAEILRTMRTRCDELVNQYGGPLAPFEQRKRKRAPKKTKPKTK